MTVCVNYNIELLPITYTRVHVLLCWHSLLPASSYKQHSRHSMSYTTALATDFIHFSSRMAADSTAAETQMASARHSVIVCRAGVRSRLTFKSVRAISASKHPIIHEPDDISGCSDSMAQVSLVKSNCVINLLNTPKQHNRIMYA